MVPPVVLPRLAVGTTVRFEPLSTVWFRLMPAFLRCMTIGTARFILPIVVTMFLVTRL